MSSADVDIARRVSMCIVDERRVVVTQERKHGMETAPYIGRVVVVSPPVERVSVRAEPDHHIAACR